MLFSSFPPDYLRAAPLKKSKTKKPGRSGRGQRVPAAGQNNKSSSMVYLPTPQAGSRPVFGEEDARKPVVMIGGAIGVARGAEIAGVPPPDCDVVSFGPMAKLWECVPWFEPDDRDYDPETLYDGISEDDHAV